MRCAHSHFNTHPRNAPMRCAPFPYHILAAPQAPNGIFFCDVISVRQRQTDRFNKTTLTWSELPNFDILFGPAGTNNSVDMPAGNRRGWERLHGTKTIVEETSIYGTSVRELPCMEPEASFKRTSSGNRNIGTNRIRRRKGTFTVSEKQSLSNLYEQGSGNTSTSILYVEENTRKGNIEGLTWKRGKLMWGNKKVGTKHYFLCKWGKPAWDTGETQRKRDEGVGFTTETNRNRIFTNSSYKWTTRRKKQL